MRKKSKSKNKISQFFNKKLSENAKTNLILISGIVACVVLYYFGFLGTLVKGLLSIFVLWSVLIGFIMYIMYWKELLALIVVIIVVTIGLGIYENFKYKRCVDKFRERPHTYDKIKFIDCGMITFEDTYKKSEEQVRYEMIYYYGNNKY